MKKIIVLFIVITTCLLIVKAQSNTDSIKVNVTETQIEYTDIPATDNTVQKSERDYSGDHKPTFQEVFGTNLGLPALVFLCVFGLPAVIVFMTLYFNYKKRKAKYQLVEKALASGQPLPEEFLRNTNTPDNILYKGISSTFTGIGLFIFLWAITDEFSIGCIGLLIMFMGFGQIVIHYIQENKKEKTKTSNRKDDQNPSIEG